MTVYGWRMLSNIWLELLLKCATFRKLNLLWSHRCKKHLGNKHALKYGICVGHCGSVYLFWLEGGLNAIQCDTSARCETLDSGKQSQKRCPWLIIMAQKHFHDTFLLNDKKISDHNGWIWFLSYPVQPFPACLGKDFIETVRWVLGTTSLPLLQREVLPTVCRARNRCLTWDGWNMAMKNIWSRYPLVI